MERTSPIYYSHGQYSESSNPHFVSLLSCASKKYHLVPHFSLSSLSLYSIPHCHVVMYMYMCTLIV